MSPRVKDSSSVHSLNVLACRGPVSDLDGAEWERDRWQNCPSVRYIEN